MKSLTYGIAWLALLALGWLPLAAHARCSYSGGNTPALVSVTFSGSPITIDPSLAVGTVIATSSAGTPSPATNSVTCSGTSTPTGLVSASGATYAGGSTIFPTGVPGIGFQVLHPDSTRYLQSYPNDSIGSGTYTLSVASTIQLIKTGPIASGATVNAGTLAYWQFQGSGGNPRVEEFSLGSAVTFVFPTCNITTSNIAVTLPAVSNTSLSSVGATAGTTAFTIGMNCPSGASGRTIAMQFDTANPASGATGVIAPSTGTGVAQNVGVQLVDSGFNPVTFGTPTVVGTTPTGAYNLTYYAQYYATANPVAAGSVKATATFTVSYP